ncbi:MAG: Kelch repeat-containing protein [Candidatus Limnocylindria bacterium]
MPARVALLVLLLLLAACSQPGASPSAPMTGGTERPSPTSTEQPMATASGTPGPSPTVEAAPEPASWAQLTVAGGPTAREDHTWTVDGTGEIAYLFGGRDGDTVFGDLWAYDLAADAWSELPAPAPAPAARFGHEAEWVEGIGLVIVFGQAGTTFFNDLWSYAPETNAWTELPAAGAVPAQRYGSCADIGTDGRLWISHGFTSDQGRFSDTVAYDFTSGTWTDETPADGGRPVDRCLHGCWWTDDGRLALYAGQTTGVTALGDLWALQDGAWTRREGTLPPDRNLYARTRLDGATVVFGGQDLEEGYLADLWRFDDGSDGAIAMEVAGEGPAGRAGAELIRDAARGRLLLFGGRDGAARFGDLWALTGIGG